MGHEPVGVGCLVPAGDAVSEERVVLPEDVAEGAEFTHIKCEVCGEATALEEAMVSLSTAGVLVHTCEKARCLAVAKTLGASP